MRPVAVLPPGPDDNLRRTIPAYSKAGSYLIRVLKNDLDAAAKEKKPISLFDIFREYRNGDAVLEAFRLQFANYTRGEDSFKLDRKVYKTPLQYWKRLRSNPNANVLAVRSSSPS